jgi:G3E family GTPase
VSRSLRTLPAPLAPGVRIVLIVWYGEGMASQANRRATVPITVVTGACEATRWAIADALASPDGVVVSAHAPPVSVGARVVDVAEETFRTNPDCPCCAVRFDLLSVIPVLACSHRPLTRIVVAAGEDSDVALVAQTLLASSEVERLAELDAVVVIVDGRRASARLATAQPLAGSAGAADQLALADHLVVTGSEDLTADALAAVSSELRRCNPLSLLWLTEASELDTTRLTGVRSFDLATVAQRSSRPVPPAPPLDPDQPGTVVIELAGDLDGDLLRGWLGRLIEHHGHDLLRLQAVFQVRQSASRRVCSGVRTTIAWGDEAASAPGGSGSRALLVGRRLDADLVRTWLAEARA